MPREQRRQPRAELQTSLDIESLGRVLGLRLTGRLLRSYRQRVVNRDKGPSSGRNRGGELVLGVHLLDKDLGRSWEVSEVGKGYKRLP